MTTYSWIDENNATRMRGTIDPAPGGSGVASVTAGDGTITVGGTATDPTVEVATAGVASANLLQSLTFTDATLTGNLDNVGAPFENVGYARYGPFVCFRGVWQASGAGLAPDDIIFTLPAGLRPTNTRRIEFASPTGITGFNVTSAGAVQVRDTFAAGTFAGMDGALFVLP